MAKISSSPISHRCSYSCGKYGSCSSSDVNVAAFSPPTTNLSVESPIMPLGGLPVVVFLEC